jgi:cell division protein FtsB
MNVAKYLFSVWAGVLLYALLFVVSGSKGANAYRQLENEQRKQEANIVLLKQMNRELENKMNSLLYDKDTLAIYAREQGYAAENERFVRIVGLGVNQKSRISTGRVIFADEPQYVPDRTLIIIAFCAGATVFICMVLFDILKRLRERA